MVDHAAKAASINDALLAIDGIRSIDSKNEFAELTNVLGDDELPKMAIRCACVSTGVGNGLMVATNQRVVYLRKGRNLRVRDMWYAAMTSVDAQRAGGNITFSSNAEKLEISYTTKSLTLAFASFVREKVAPSAGEKFTGPESPSTETQSIAKAKAIEAALRTIDRIEEIDSNAELAELPNVLKDNELPEMALKCHVVGKSGVGIVLATNQRVIWLHKGRNLDIKEISYTEIAAVEHLGGGLVFSGDGERLAIGGLTSNPSGLADLVRDKSGLLEKVAATNAKTDAINEALRSIDTGGTFSSKWEVKRLPDILGDGELPLMVASGSYKGTRSRSASIGVLVATDRRLLFVDKGLFNSLTVEDFPYSTIQSVEASTGMMSGSVVIKSAGNAEEIGYIAKDRTHAFASFIREKVAEHQSPLLVTASPNAASLVSVADELLKLAQLREAGILTNEEFEAQKAKWLG